MWPESLTDARDRRDRRQAEARWRRRQPDGRRRQFSMLRSVVWGIASENAAISASNHEPSSRYIW